MKKIFFLLSMFICILNADNNLKTVKWQGMISYKKDSSILKWYKNYKKAFKIAQKNNKLVMIDISKHNCSACEYMREMVFNNNEVKTILKNKFVLVKYYSNEVPKKFRSEYFNFAPTILFYNKNGKLIDEIYGASPYKKFLNELTKIIKGK